jgi:hypothetical protein
VVAREHPSEEFEALYDKNKNEMSPATDVGLN